MTAHDPIWHDVGHRLPPDDTPTATPSDQQMAAWAWARRLERLDEVEAQREQRRQQ